MVLYLNILLIMCAFFTTNRQSMAYAGSLTASACVKHNKAHLELTCPSGYLVTGSIRGGVVPEGQANDNCTYQPDHCLAVLNTLVVLTDDCLWQKNACDIQAGFMHLLMSDVCSDVSTSYTADYLWAEYNCIPEESVADICDTTVLNPTLTNDAGYITSPNYPNAYVSEDCYKIISVEKEYGIRLSSTSMDIPNWDGECQDSYVEITPEYASARITKHCKDFVRDIPHYEVKVRFVGATNTQGYRGFVVNIEKYLLPSTTTLHTTTIYRKPTPSSGIDEKEIVTPTKEDFWRDRNIIIFGICGAAVLVCIISIVLGVEVYKRRSTGQCNVVRTHSGEYESFPTA